MEQSPKVNALTQLGRALAITGLWLVVNIFSLGMVKFRPSENKPYRLKKIAAGAVLILISFMLLATIVASAVISHNLCEIYPNAAYYILVFSSGFSIIWPLVAFTFELTPANVSDNELLERKNKKSEDEQDAEENRRTYSYCLTTFFKLSVPAILVATWIFLNISWIWLVASLAAMVMSISWFRSWRFGEVLTRILVFVLSFGLDKMDDWGQYSNEERNLNRWKRERFPLLGALLKLTFWDAFLAGLALIIIACLKNGFSLWMLFWLPVPFILFFSTETELMSSWKKKETRTSGIAVNY